MHHTSAASGEFCSSGHPLQFSTGTIARVGRPGGASGSTPKPGPLRDRWESNPDRQWRLQQCANPTPMTLSQTTFEWFREFAKHPNCDTQGQPIPGTKIASRGECRRSAVGSVTTEWRCDCNLGRRRHNFRGTRRRSLGECVRVSLRSTWRKTGLSPTGCKQRPGDSIDAGSVEHWSETQPWPPEAITVEAGRVILPAGNFADGESTPTPSATDG